VSDVVDDYAAIAELYDHVTVYRDRPDVAFFVEFARDAGSPVLELGSGTGRVLLPIARAGIEVVGLDSSPSMLAVCRRLLEQEPPAVRARAELVEGDMRSFDLGRTFTLITIPFRPFQHLVTVEDQLACLESIRRHLKPSGRLILDLFNPSLEVLAQPVGVESPPESEFSMPDGRRVTRRFRIVSRDRANQVNHVELIYDVIHPDGRAERLIHAFPMRYLFRFEVEHLLARAGFAVEQLYSAYDKSPFGSSYPGELIFVARLV
jgi:SAM-dependent methyltransferase